MLGQGPVPMIRNRRLRRLLAAIAVMLGGVAMFLAPKYWPGALALFALGIVLEAVGISLERKN